MNLHSMRQLTQEAVKGKFGRQKYLSSVVVPYYPFSTEREYLRLCNDYMNMFHNTVAMYDDGIRSRSDVK